MKPRRQVTAKEIWDIVHYGLVKGVLDTKAAQELGCTLQDFMYTLHDLDTLLPYENMRPGVQDLSSPLDVSIALHTLFHQLSYERSKMVTLYASPVFDQLFQINQEVMPDLHDQVIAILKETSQS